MSGLRRRIALAAVAASAAALLAVLLLVGGGLRRRAMDYTRDKLIAEARLMARVVEDPLARGAGVAELDALVDDAAREVHARVTVIAPDGRVLADSSLSGSDLLAVENHRSRPEIAAALAEGSGASARHSATVNEDLLYVAVPIKDSTGRLLGVSRVAFSLHGVEEQAAELRRSVALALGLAFMVTALFSFALSSSLAGPLREIMDAARRFAAGDLGARSRVDRRDELGELARILNKSADALQERLTEIARDRARSDAILAAMEDGLLGVDDEGVVILANEAFRRSLGAGEPRGRHYLEVVRHPDVARVIEEILASGEPRRAELAVHHLRRAFAVTGAPFPPLEGRRHGAVLTFHDITERKRADRMRREFVASASHELRTPLTSLRGFVEALEDGGLADPSIAGRFLAKVRTQVDRMAALVSDLLELSSLEAGERPPQWQQVRAADILEDVLASFAAQAARNGVSLRSNGDTSTAVDTDPDRLRRILESIVDNAIKYTPAGGTVQVQARGVGDTGVVFEVADDGPGIAAEHLPRIFERFYRVDKARSRELGGTGLGLAIAKHLAESIGASITVQSEIGRGTRFSVRVPPRPARQAIA